MEDLLFGGRKSNNQPQRKSVKSGKQLDIAMKSLVSQLKITSTGLSPMQQLELKYNADNIDDLNELRTILSKKLKYPSQSVAETHHNANRLGHYDIHRQKEELSLLINDNTRFCACCGFVEQEQTLSINQDLKNIDHIGVSTYIYFLTIKNILVLMISMMIVFSFYALITNKTASNMYSSYQKQNSGGLVDKKVNSYDGELAYSLGSKQLYKTSYGVQTFRVQCWLGVATISLWALLFVFFKYRQQTAEYDVDYDSITASDFSLYFENLPKSMTPQLLQRQLRQYQQQMKGYYKSHLISDPITVVKIVEATPFYLDESSFDDKQLKSISKQFEECKQKLIEMVEERKDEKQFKMSIDERTELYNKFQFLKNKKVLRLKEITDEIIEQKKQQSINWNVVPAFVTFGSSYSKQFLQRVHDKTSYKFIYTLPCLSGRRKYFHYQSAHGQKVAAKILPAPQPQDILWTNLGQDSCQIIKKKMLTFFVTLVLLTISFFVTYFMSSLQLSLGNTGTEAQKSMRSTILSTAISLFISIFNIVINKILYILTKYERNETYIDEQTSLGLKAAFAVLINSILIPIIVNKTLKYNLYGVDGLAQDVYYLAITNALLSPILKIIDPSFFTNRAMRWYYNRPYNRLPLNQNQLNDINELLQFSIGYQYIYLVNVFLFTCFFVSLQPVIVFFAIIGLFLMFYAQKYYLFNRCRRPTPGYTSINTAMYQLFYLGPMMYSLGSFCWSNFFDLSNTVGTVPNTVAIIISGVVFILPYKKLLKCIVAQRPEQKLVFEEDRIFLPSEYDRMNPQTAEKASIQYKDYIANYKDKLKNKSSSQIQQVVYQLNRQCGTGHRSNRHIVPRMPGFFGFEQASSVDDQMVVQQLLGGINRNSINPLIIGNSVLPDSSNRENAPISINTVAQNWLTQQELSNNRNSGIQNINPIAGLLQNLTKDQGETVNYQTTNVNAENTGDINLNFGNLIQNDIFGGNRFNNHPHGGRHPGNRGNGHNIPMNLPLNLFGNMLNTNVNPNKNAWENWGS